MPEYEFSGASGGGSPSGAAGGSLAGTYPNPTIASGAITTTEIADGTIVNADISGTAAIAKSKLASLAIADADVASGAAIAPVKLADTPGLTSGSPADVQGYLSWNYDPILPSGSTSTITSGVLYTFMVPWPYTGKAIANVDYMINTAAITPTAGQNFVAIYGPTGGTALGSLASDTAFTGTGLKTAAIAVAAVNLPSTGPGAYIYIAFLQNSATAPVFPRLPNGPAAGVINAQYRASSSPRFGTFGTAQTAVPSLTVASIAGGGIGLSTWVGVR